MAGPLVVCTPRLISSILHLRRFWYSGADCIQNATPLTEFRTKGLDHCYVAGSCASLGCRL